MEIRNRYQLNQGFCKFKFKFIMLYWRQIDVTCNFVYIFFKAKHYKNINIVIAENKVEWKLQQNQNYEFCQNFKGRIHSFFFILFWFICQI